MLLVPRPAPIQRHPGSVVFIASSVRHTPPPAVPTHSRQPRRRSQSGEIARADTRPDTLSDSIVAPEFKLVSGPSDAQIAPSGCPDDRNAMPRNAQYLLVEAWMTAELPGTPGYACS